MYYNTTSQSGDELQEFIASAGAQDSKIMEAIIGMDSVFSPRDLTTLFPEMPITSIRRSLNTLVKKEFITKTGKKVDSIYGRPEFQYILK
jgi:predicted transcriptional regulator